MKPSLVARAVRRFNRLRAWHKQDPVSKEERERNDRAAKHQKSRNPYVDYPNLTNRIKNF